MKRPTYCPFQNISYMIRRAYREAPVILPVAAGMIVAGTAINILELVTAPAILDAVERNVPIAALLRMIAALTAAMLLACSGRAYLWENALFGQVHLRINISSQLHSKFCTTSYAHLLDTAYIERSNKAQLATQGNTDATEAIWDTLVELCTNAISFSVYLLLLGSANPVILAITLVAAVFSYSAGKRIRLWRYQHQDEEAAYRQRLSYIAKRARSRELAKDIRIFGLKAWLQALWGQSLALYHDFCKKAEKRHLLADTVDILATLLRNGAAYAYLLRMTLLGELNAPEFVLLFSAVTGLGSWTTGLLRNLETLNKQSSDISFVREYLDTPEPFPFDEGEPLAVKPNHRYTMELRLGGIQEAWRARNLRFTASRDLISVANFSARETEEQVGAWLDGLQGRPLPTAFLVGGDFMAAGTVSALQKRGLRVPQDVSVMSIDGFNLAAIQEVPLTAVHVPRDELGSEAVHLLQQRLLRPEAPHGSLLLHGTLVVRDSVRRIRPGKGHTAVEPQVLYDY